MVFGVFEKRAEKKFLHFFEKKVHKNLVGKKMSVYLQPVSEMTRLKKKVH
jgi:hypothetical protein